MLAGGGTAGHTSPLIATAHELTRLRPGRSRLTAVGTARGLENTVVPAAGLPLELIPPVPMPRRPGKDLLLVPAAAVAGGAADARGCSQPGRADVVLGFGGYVSTPVYLAARRRRRPDRHPRAERAARTGQPARGPVRHHVFTSFPDTPLPHATCIGLPLRRGITELDRRGAGRPARAGFGLPAERPPCWSAAGRRARRASTEPCAAPGRLLAAGVQVLHVLGSEEPHRATTSADRPRHRRRVPPRRLRRGRWRTRTRPPT